MVLVGVWDLVWSGAGTGLALEDPRSSAAGGVELVTGANTVSLLILTSHWPDVPYLRASSLKFM